MAKNITPGTLCLTVNAEDLSGFVVTAKVRAKAGTGFKIRTTHGQTVGGVLLDDCWFCAFQRPVNLSNTLNLYVEEFPIPERCLLPLSDPDAELITDKAKEEHV